MSIEFIPKEYLKELEEVIKTEKFQEIRGLVNKLNNELAALAVFSSEDKARGQASIHKIWFELEFSVVLKTYSY